jgi:tetratricopeptide (TPR) repeat protein
VVTWRRRRAEEVVPIAAAVAAYAVWSLLNFAWAPVTAPLWILAGVAWAAAQAGQVERATFMRRRAVAVPASLLLISAGMYLAAAPLVADIAYQRGQPRLAATAFPLQAEYHRVLGERTSSIPELRRAAELGESDSAVFVLLGDLELGNGQRAAADADYRRAAELNPFDQAARARLAALAEAEH